jgi:hypothetical protein
MMRSLLTDPQVAKDKNWLCWDLRTKGKTHKVIFKPEVCMFVGDNEGQTKACGMYQMCGNVLSQKGTEPTYRDGDEFYQVSSHVTQGNQLQVVW